MSDNDATQVRQDVVADVDEILEHVINANMLSMPYHVYFELFDAVAGIGVEIENLQSENAELRKLVRDTYAFLAWADGATHYGGEPAVHASDRKEVERRMRELGVEETE